MNNINLHYPIVCFGETLWDFLPQGKLPGGAPVNVAYHLKMLGENPAVISRIGKDELGKELREVFERKKIQTRFFQTDNEFPTGKVFAQIRENNEVQYDIVKPAAWDYIEWNKEVSSLVSGADYFVFGSLVTRNETSKNTLYKCLEIAKIKVFDINLRPPYFNKPVLEELLRKTDILKLNLEELHFIAAWFLNNYDTDEERIRRIQQKFEIETVIVTKGADGALLYRDHAFYHHPGYPVDVADTIGSGDSFLAAMISQFIDDSSPEKALDFASALGGFVASCSGGCPEYQVQEVVQMINKRDPKMYH